MSENPLFRKLDNYLLRVADLDAETVLARYGSRLTVSEINEALLRAVDGALAARTDGELQQQLDQLRLTRRTMPESERQGRSHDGEERGGCIRRLQRQVREIEALPEEVQDAATLDRLRAELARLQQVRRRRPEVSGPQGARPKNAAHA